MKVKRLIRVRRRALTKKKKLRRLSLEGFLITLLVVFPAVLFLEWVFDLNNKKRFDELERKIKETNKKR